MWRQANTTDLGDMLGVAEEESRAKARADRARAQAYAQVCRAVGTTERNMTPGQRELAEAIFRRSTGARTSSRGAKGSVPYGFSIPTEGRFPIRR